jgi:hypothetical protein
VYYPSSFFPIFFFILQSIVCSIQLNTTGFTALLNTANRYRIGPPYFFKPIPGLYISIIGLPFPRNLALYDYVCIFAVRSPKVVKKTN